MRLTLGALTLLLAACMPGTAPSSTGASGTIEIAVVAGPVCPVEREPPDPDCEPRPVEGARIFVQPGDGRDIMVGEATTGADGRARIELPAGDYLVVGGEVEGLMGRPEPIDVRLEPSRTVTVDLAYDTGIR